MTLDDIFSKTQACEMAGIKYYEMEVIERLILKEGVDFKRVGKPKVYTREAIEKIKVFITNKGTANVKEDEPIKDYGDDFEYLGYHFKPYRKLKKDDRKRLATDKELGFTRYEWNSKVPYDYEAFYKASGDSEADVFLCRENSKLYVPCLNELFWINGTYVKEGE